MSKGDRVEIFGINKTGLGFFGDSRQDTHGNGNQNLVFDHVFRSAARSFERKRRLIQRRKSCNWERRG